MVAARRRHPGAGGGGDGVILPNFLIAGAMKAGTTTMWWRLRRHPDVFMPDLKEPRFFVGADVPTSIHRRGIDWYARLFSAGAGRTAIGEASVVYLVDPESPALIEKYLGAPRLVFILRDPVARAYSHYWQERKRGIPLAPFDELVGTGRPPLDSFLRGGRYGTHLARYFDRFPRERLLVLRYEELRDTPDVLFRRLCTFLELDPDRLPPAPHARRNAASLPRSDVLERRVLRSRRVLAAAKALMPARLYPLAQVTLFRLKQLNRVEIGYPAMSGATRARLIEALHGEIEATEALLGWDLSAWKRVE